MTRDEALVKAALDAALGILIDSEWSEAANWLEYEFDPAAIIASVPRSFEDDLRSLAAGDAPAEAFAEKVIAAGAPEPRGYGADISSSTSAGNFRLPPDPRDAEIERLRGRVKELEAAWKQMEAWQKEGEALLGNSSWGALFDIGVWWADRPWRERKK